MVQAVLQSLGSNPQRQPQDARVAATEAELQETSEMAGFWENRFDDLEDLLRRMDQ